jgi:hypothetical protein
MGGTLLTPGSGRFLDRTIPRPALAAVLLTAGFLVVSLWVFPLFFETIDDANMNLIAAGRGYTDGPDEHLMFSNVLVGFPLKWLYQLAPEVPWYGGYLVGVMACSFLAMCMAFLFANPTVKQLLLAAVVLAAYGLPCLLSLQFTRVGCLAALGGLLLWLNAALGRGPRWQAWVGGPLILVGCLVRFESGLLAGVVLAPALGWGILRTFRSRKTLALSVYLLVLAGCCFGLQRFNRWYYDREGGWGGYFDWAPLVSQFIDDQRVEYNEGSRPIIAEVGWTWVDLYMLLYCGYADAERFSTEKLRTVLENVPLSDRATGGRSIDDLEKRLWVDGDLFVLLLAGGLCLVVMGGGLAARVLPLLCSLVALGVCMVLFLYLRLPARVYFPALGAFLPVAVCASRPQPANRPRWLSLVAGAVVVCSVLELSPFLTLQFRDALKQTERKAAIAEECRDMMQRLAPRPDQLFLQWSGGWLSTEYLVYPLRRMAVPAGFKTIGLGADCRIPPGRRILARFGISDVYRGMCGRRDVFLLSNDPANDVLEAYLQLHYGVEIKPRAVFDHPALWDSRFFHFTIVTDGRPAPDEPADPDR